MRILRDTGLQLALVKEILDVNAQKQQIEIKIRAAEERSKLLLENAARREIEVYIQSKLRAASTNIPESCVFQLSLTFDKMAVPAAVSTAASCV